jgi:hypothetical protein
VCEVLKDSQKYHMKMVRIRGRFEGTREGVWLVGDTCKGDVWLEVPQPMPRPHHTQVDFKYDEEAEARVSARAQELLQRVPKRCLVYTQTGLFETVRGRNEKITDPNSPSRTLGFGHLNGSSAQLIVKSMDDVEAQAGCLGKH